MRAPKPLLDADGWPVEKNTLSFSERSSANEVIAQYEMDKDQLIRARRAICDRAMEPNFNAYFCAHNICAGITRAAEIEKGEAALAPHRDGFVLMNAQLPEQFAYAIAETISSEDADGWFEAYSCFDRYSAAAADATDTAEMIFAASQAGNVSDTYNDLEDVERDAVLRIRVFDDGSALLFECSPVFVMEEPAIVFDEAPIKLLTVENIMNFTGSPRPKLQSDDAPSP